MDGAGPAMMAGVKNPAPLNKQHKGRR